MAKNTVCHIEWEVTDLARAQAFYQGMFDWKFQQFGDTMVVFGSGDTHIGGLMKSDSPTIGSSPSVWIEADDLDEYCARAQALGGALHSEKSPVPNVGWSAIVGDPDGNHIGLVQFAERSL